VLGKKNVLMQAYGQGMINVKMFHNGMWHGATLRNIWYVPGANAHLFSVKAAAKNGCSTTLNGKEFVIRKGDATVAASGKLLNGLNVLEIRVCIPRHAAEVELATQAETLQA
jgi:hypothetical protein